MGGHIKHSLRPFDIKQKYGRRLLPGTNDTGMKRILIILFVTLLAVSCSSERSIDTYQEEGEQFVEVLLHGRHYSATRAAIAEENIVEHLDLFVFKDDKFLYWRSAYKVNERFRASLAKGEGLDVHFIANARNIINALHENGEMTAGMSWEQLRKKLVDTEPVGLKYTDPSEIRLPMWGLMQNQRVQDVAVNSWGSLYLIRSVASVDVLVSENVDNFTFTLEDIYLYFVPRKGFLAPSAENYDVAGHTVIASESPADMQTILTLHTDAYDTENQSIANQLYLYDNDTDDSSRTQQPDKTRRNTRLVIGGRYKGKKYYWPVDFEAGNNTLDKITRNWKYIFQINSVSSAGYTDPEMASTEPPVGMNVNVVKWNEKEENEFFVSSTYYVGITGSRDVVLSCEQGSAYTVAVRSNVKASQISLDFADAHNGTSIQGPGEVYNQRFKVEAVADGDDNLRGLLVTALQDYNDSKGEEDSNRDRVIFTAGRIEFELSLTQIKSRNLYLNLIRPEEGVPVFPSAPGTMTGEFSVVASGPWTASLFLDGFSFSGIEADKIQLTSAEATEGKFRIYTTSPNPTYGPRQGVVVVSLDEDPEHYAVSIVLSQKAPGGISILPESEIEFEGSGEAVISDLVEIFPSYEDDGIGSMPRYTISDWGYGLFDYDTKEPYSGNRFTVSLQNRTGATNIIPGTNGLNTLQVAVNGANNTTVRERVILRVWLVEDKSKYAEIVLIQRPKSFTLSPATVSIIPAVGGTTSLITVEGDSGMKWNAVSAMVSTPYSGRRLVNHEASFFDQNGNALDLSQPQDMSTQFRVVMPKIYWPNREISNITLVVLVELLNPDGTGTGVKANIGVMQQPLYSKGFNAWDVRPDGWGSLMGGNHFDAYKSAINSWSGYRVSRNYVESGSEATTYVHLNTRNLKTYNWSDINTFIARKDGVTLILGDDSDAQSVLNSSSSPLYLTGYRTEYGGDGSGYGVAVVNSDVFWTRIYQLLMRYGKYVKTPELSTKTKYGAGHIHFKIDNVRSEATSIPRTAVPVVKNLRSGRTIMGIDPTTKLIYLGECQLFESPENSDIATYGHGYAFMCNFLHYIENAAKYGSHFTDMLIDFVNLGTPSQKLNPVPAPWDEVWGDNKW